MYEKLDELIRYWLREASTMGDRGFTCDENAEQDEDWMYFENMAIDNIKNHMSAYEALGY